MPGVTTFEKSPVLVRCASAGGAATSGGAGIAGGLDHQGIGAPALQIDVGLAPEMLDRDHAALELPRPAAAFDQVLRTHAHGDLLAGRDAVLRHRRRQRGAVRHAHRDAVRRDAGHLAIEEVHLRRSDEAGDEQVLRMVVQL